MQEDLTPNRGQITQAVRCRLSSSSSLVPSSVLRPLHFFTPWSEQFGECLHAMIASADRPGLGPFVVVWSSFASSATCLFVVLCVALCVVLCVVRVPLCGPLRRPRLRPPPRPLRRPRTVVVVTFWNSVVPQNASGRFQKVPYWPSERSRSFQKVRQEGAEADEDEDYEEDHDDEDDEEEGTVEGKEREGRAWVEGRRRSRPPSG